MKFRLINLDIINFYNHAFAELKDLKNYNVLIGQNNAGKSNIIKIIKAIKGLLDGNNLDFNILFDRYENTNAEITFTFKLCDDYRKEIFKLLYKRNLFVNIEKDLSLSHNKWFKEILKDLIKDGYLSSIEITFAYNSIIKNLIVKQIRAIHNNSASNLFEIKDLNDNSPQYYLLENSDLSGSSTLESFFEKTLTKSHPKPYPGGNLREFFNEVVYNPQNPIRQNFLLNNLIKDIVHFFVNSIHFIHDKRRFERSSEMNDLYKTVLSPNGQNLSKFLGIKAINDRKWIDEFLEELKEYFPYIEQFSSRVENNRIILFSKENNLDNILYLENMGSGILNIAFFLATLKELSDGSILLIEEPELHIFPGLQKQIRNKFLKSSEKIQIFISTHSRDMLVEDEKLCSIYSVKKYGVISKIIKIPKEHFLEIYDDLDIDLNEYEKQKSIIHKDSYWSNFITKNLDRTEGELWDFKQTFEMWEVSELSLKAIKQIDFCEKVAAFANAQGGVFIVGVTDKIPRKIIGVSDLENKMQSIKTIARKWIDFNRDFIILKETLMKDDNDCEQQCLIIVVAQTKGVMGVKHEDGRFSYPIRLETGLDRYSYSEIEDRKREITANNFDFLRYFEY